MVRESRAHWVLLLLGMLVLFGELALNGYVLGVGAEGHGAPAPRRAGAAAAPADVTAGGPVLRLTPDGRAQTSAVPAGTVALTFDDGPDPRWTPQVLDVLRRHHAHATFFVIGSRVNQYPDLARRIVAEGNELGVHTFTHVELATVPSWQRRLELTLGQNAIVGATGRQPTLMRPPYASEPNALTGPDFEALRDVAAAGYLTVLADRDTDDWRRPGVDAIVRAATPEAGRGAVVTMHDSGGDRSQTVAALDRLLTALSSRGYRFPTVSDGLYLE